MLTFQVKKYGAPTSSAFRKASLHQSRIVRAAAFGVPGILTSPDRIGVRCWRLPGCEDLVVCCFPGPYSSMCASANGHSG